MNQEPLRPLPLAELVWLGAFWFAIRGRRGSRGGGPNRTGRQRPESSDHQLRLVRPLRER